MRRIFVLLIVNVIVIQGFGQYNWKVEKDKDGIKVSSSAIPNAGYKAVKVECTFSGTYAKLIGILTNIESYPDWIYNTKKTKVLQQINSLDIIYYTETRFPWPFSNRDAIIHLRIRHDTISKMLTISGANEPTLVPEFPDKVRISNYSANWIVTMPTLQTIQISYILAADPGGNVPSWLSGMFIDKGPYETFKKLGERLSK